MTLTGQIADHLRAVHFGGNWTGVCLQKKLADLTWQQATTRVESFHPIATLVFHMNYYIAGTIRVLEGGPLDIRDKFSFDHEPVSSQKAWDALLERTWSDAGKLADMIEQLPDDQLLEHFVKQDYGTHFRCLMGIVEHCHYHLGQISMIRTLLDEETVDDRRV